MVSLVLLVLLVCYYELATSFLATFDNFSQFSSPLATFFLWQVLETLEEAMEGPEDNYDARGLENELFLLLDVASRYENAEKGT